MLVGTVPKRGYWLVSLIVIGLVVDIMGPVVLVNLRLIVKVVVPPSVVLSAMGVTETLPPLLVITTLPLATANCAALVSMLQ
jgi:hypothetical protein